jgi:hypothetical protein
MITYKLFNIQQGLLELRYYEDGEYINFKICAPEDLKGFLKALNIPEENLIKEDFKEGEKQC